MSLSWSAASALFTTILKRVILSMQISLLGIDKSRRELNLMNMGGAGAMECVDQLKIA